MADVGRRLGEAGKGVCEEGHAGDFVSLCRSAAPSTARAGGAGKIVESDETFIGKNTFSPKGRRKPGVAFRNVVLTLVERGGSARSFHIDSHKLAEVTAIVRANVHRETAIKYR